MIYFDNSATSIHKPERVINAVVNAMHNFGNPGRGAYGASLLASRAVHEARENIALLFGVKNSQQVVFTQNATEAINIIIRSLISRDDHVITTVFEHNSVLRPLYATGCNLQIVPCDKDMQFDYHMISNLVTSKTKAIICTHASNVTGDLLDINRVGEICKQKGILFLLDASQTAGVFPIHMQDNHIDAIMFTGHKSLMAPQGTGGFCIKENIILTPEKVGGSGFNSYSKNHPENMPERMEAGTLNSHGIAGLNAGVEFILETGLSTILKKEQDMAHYFYQTIKNNKNIQFYGNYELQNRAPIVALNVAEIDSSDISTMLYENYLIATRGGAHCAPLIHKFLNTTKQGIVRFSFSYFNTFTEVDNAITALNEITEEV